MSVAAGRLLLTMGPESYLPNLPALLYSAFATWLSLCASTPQDPARACSMDGCNHQHARRHGPQAAGQPEARPPRGGGSRGPCRTQGAEARKARAACAAHAERRRHRHAQPRDAEVRVRRRRLGGPDPEPHR